MRALTGRRLTAGERELARGVFGEMLGLDRVRLASHPFGGFAVTTGARINFPGRTPADFAEGDLRARAWLIHELVHVWQFQTAPWRTLRSWARVTASGGYGPGLPGYRYPTPPPPWEALNLEQQASLVEHAFIARESAPRFGAGSELVAGARYAGLTPFAALG